MSQSWNKVKILGWWILISIWKMKNIFVFLLIYKWKLKLLKLELKDMNKT